MYYKSVTYTKGNSIVNAFVGYFRKFYRPPNNVDIQLNALISTINIF